MRIIKYLIIIMILSGLCVQVPPLFTSLNPVYAIQNQYTNQLLKLNVSKSSDNGVNVKLYTSKPYPIQLSPIKKSDDEYIIFLPETYHSITSKPDFSSCSDTINDVDVKLIPYVGSNSNNGYTKIIIKTNGEDVKLNLSNEVSRQDVKLQEELSRVLNHKVPLRAKKQPSANKNIKKIAYVERKKPQSVISAEKKAIINTEKKKPQPVALTVNKATVDTGKVNNIVSHKPKLVSKEPPEEREPKIAEEKEPKVQVQEKKVTINVPDVQPKAAAGKPANESKHEIPVNNQVPANNTVTGQTQQGNKTENQQQKPEVAKNPVNNVKPAPVEKPAPQQKQSASPLMIVLPIIAGIFALLIIIRVIARLKKNQRDMPIRITPETEDDWVEDNGEESQEASEEDGSVSSVLAGVKVSLNSRKDSIPQEDMMADLSQNPVKPQNNPLKDKGYMEVSPDELNEEPRDLRKEPDPTAGLLKFIAGAEIGNDEGIYLVEAEEEKILIGIRGAEIFILNKFDQIANSKFVIRKTTREASENKDVYFVQVGTWCGLVSTMQEGLSLESVF